MIRSTPVFGALGALAFSGVLIACSAPGRPPQSPANDTPPPVTSTGSGDLMGAQPAEPIPVQPTDGPNLDSKDNGKSPEPRP
ncbi:MAG TPA: hypothetical protein VHB79_01370 [Polyangiaceae bacterium]|nr:hypothetical protein [Polyangiaceae bacterium]